VWATKGLDTDGWTRRGRPATLRIYGLADGPARMVELQLTLLAPPAPAIYRITAPDESLAGPLFQGTDRTETVSVCVPAGSAADVELVGWSNARIAGPPLAAPVERLRRVGVGVTKVAVTETGRDCADASPS
jgi:hypothetical protein